MENDEREQNPITDNPDKLNELWGALNRSALYQYNRNLVNKEDGLSPKSLLGSCVQTTDQAASCFKVSSNKDELPLCGLPRCL